eukprot:6204952-Pleurochrysis_carterae.AAC.7
MGAVASNVKTMGGMMLRAAQVSVRMKAGPWRTDKESIHGGGGDQLELPAVLVAAPCPLKLHVLGHVNLSVGWHHVVDVAAKALED